MNQKVFFAVFYEIHLLFYGCLPARIENYSLPKYPKSNEFNLITNFPFVCRFASCFRTIVFLPFFVAFERRQNLWRKFISLAFALMCLFDINSIYDCNFQLILHAEVIMRYSCVQP